MYACGTGESLGSRSGKRKNGYLIPKGRQMAVVCLKGKREDGTRAERGKEPEGFWRDMPRDAISSHLEN